MARHTQRMLRVAAARPLAPPRTWCGQGIRWLASKSAKKGGQKQQRKAEAPSSSKLPPSVPPLRPWALELGGGPIDDYRREGKRTPQQLLVEAKVAKNYSRLKMAEDKRHRQDLARRGRLVQAAIRALPTEHLRREARTPDLADLPPELSEPLGIAIGFRYEGETDEKDTEEVKIL